MTRNEQILQMRAEGKSLSAIGRELGISQQRVSQLVKAYKAQPNKGQETDTTTPATSPQAVPEPQIKEGGGDKEGVIQTQDINSIKDKDVAVMNDLIEAREKIVKGIIDNGRSLKKERLQSLVVSAGIVIDKIRLLQGDPTAIFRHQSIIADMSDEELRRIAGIEAPGHISTLSPDVGKVKQAESVDTQGNEAGK